MSTILYVAIIYIYIYRPSAAFQRAFTTYTHTEFQIVWEKRNDNRFIFTGVSCLAKWINYYICCVEQKAPIYRSDLKVAKENNVFCTSYNTLYIYQCVQCALPVCRQETLRGKQNASTNLNGNYKICIVLLWALLRAILCIATCFSNRFLHSNVVFDITYIYKYLSILQSVCLSVNGMLTSKIELYI